jgi:hypothetical protein
MEWEEILNTEPVTEIPENVDDIIDKTVEAVKNFREMMEEFLTMGLSDENIDKAVGVFEKGYTVYQNAVFYVQALGSKFGDLLDTSRGGKALEFNQKLHAAGAEDTFRSLQNVSTPSPYLSELGDVRMDTV